MLKHKIQNILVEIEAKQNISKFIPKPNMFYINIIFFII